MTTLESKFNKFDAANPVVYVFFKRFAFQAMTAGRRKLSASLIMERIRWELSIETYSDTQYKICNNHTAYYARKFMKDFPEYGPIFFTKQLRST
jgi:hypothetical protein